MEKSKKVRRERCPICLELSHLIDFQMIGPGELIWTTEVGECCVGDMMAYIRKEKPWPPHIEKLRRERDEMRTPRKLHLVEQSGGDE